MTLPRKSPVITTMKKKGGRFSRLKDEHGLTPQQNLFVREYIKDYCGSRAAVRAKYSERSAKEQASTLLTKDNIQAAVTREERKLQNRFYVSKERILKELALIGYADLSEYTTVNEDGQVQINALEDLPPQISRALKTIKEKTKSTISSDGETVFREGHVEIVLHDKIAALNLMGKEIGMFKDKCEVTGKNGGPIKIQEMSDEELLAIIQGGSSPGDAKAAKGTRKSA